MIKQIWHSLILTQWKNKSRMELIKSKKRLSK